MTRNTEAALLLEKVGAVFRVLEGDSFRSKAYFNAAVVLNNLAESIDDLYTKNKLKDIPGIGEGMRKYLGEYIKKGKVRHFESLFKKVPAGMFPLMEIRGIGPVTAYKIAKRFRLIKADKALGELKKLVEQDRITDITGFREKTTLKIKKALDVNAGGKRRLLLAEALPIAEDFIAYLNKSSLIVEAEPLGSLRRKVSTIGDIDMAINSKKPVEAMKHALGYPEISSIITKGDKVSHIKLKNGYEVDIKCSTPDQWGSLLQHYTGSKLHNIKLRTKTQASGVSLSEYGIKKGEKLHKFNNEKDFYNYLGLSYIPPELREDRGEIEGALKDGIPKLIKEADIKGDLHVHSDYDYPNPHDSGVSTLEAIFDKAQQLDYEYIGFSDHNPKYLGLTEKEKEKILIARKRYLMSQYHAYENKVKKSSVKLLIGLEVDIRPDGKRAVSDKLMDTLDYAIVSIHSSFELSQKETTERILDGLDHPKALILGHPTGRRLNFRDSLQADWDKIFDFCAKNKKIVEINADPARLDLPDDLIKEALKFGVRFIINTDSHYVSHMKYMKYGVWQAMRGWARKKDIVNTLPYKDLQSVLEFK
ncbi:MAG: PHP domain protein [Candidatus Collierbacteria bacterium GW2011_GWA1_44_12]|uniref:PHP domain protein n=1 Tax=Candidatus Collierbacteria bacterium GW2011_GWA1_44_12 TaxID=1618376 RepID=A0A0G1GI55_9BACT|nr:MAG: PHP domain protein [Candidatus Collierbacteria bacterium GW2011_GWA1_44_12]